MRKPRLNTCFYWSGKRDSNSRLQPWQSSYNLKLKIQVLLTTYFLYTKSQLTPYLVTDVFHLLLTIRFTLTTHYEIEFIMMRMANHMHYSIAFCKNCSRQGH